MHLNLTVYVEKVVLILLVDAPSLCEMAKLQTKAGEFALIPPHYIPMRLLPNSLILAPANIEYCRYSGTNSNKLARKLCLEMLVLQLFLFFFICNAEFLPAKQ